MYSLPTHVVHTGVKGVAGWLGPSLLELLPTLFGESDFSSGGWGGEPRGAGINLCMTPTGVVGWGVVGEATTGNRSGPPGPVTIGSTWIGVAV